MFLKQLRHTLTLALSLVLMIAMAGWLTHTTLAGRQADDRKEEQQKDKPPPAAEDKLTSLLKQRVEAAKAEVDARNREFLAGQGTLAILFEASTRLLHAQMELSDKKADQLAALEAHFELTKVIEDRNQARFNAGLISMADVSQAKYFRLEAEILLERAKAK
jgi:outer membrane protein TolC